MAAHREDPPRGWPGPEAPFSEPRLFVCTYEADLSNLGTPHSELIGRLAPAGAVKALNCNYGHFAQPGFERFLKHPRPRPEGGWAPRPGLEGRPAGGLAPAMVRQRKLQGDGTCFNSAIEAVVVPGPEDGPFPPQLEALFAANPEKHYAVKSFPTTGKTQVPGVLDPGLVDGAFVARLWARFLTDQAAGRAPGLPVEVVAERPIMQNFKFHLNPTGAREVLDLPRLVLWLERLKDRPGPLPLPYPIRELKHAQDNQNISFKFQLGGANRRVRVNIFYRGKVNILGAGTHESARRIHSFLCEAVRAHWGTFVALRPLPDVCRADRPPAAQSPGGGGLDGQARDGDSDGDGPRGEGRAAPGGPAD